MPSTTLTIEADYHQLYLLDDGRHGDLAEAWTVKATEDRQAIIEGMIGVGTEADGPVRVTIAPARAEPALELERWDHATECSLEVRSGRLVVAGCTE